jgi:predicted O-methyltransferase YrrM
MKIPKFDTLITTAEEKIGKLKKRQHETIAVSTHLPILMFLARTRKISKVLEFGSGMFSTLNFLDKNCFPDLNHLKSYETDAFWASKMKELVMADPRSELIFSENPLAGLVANMDMDFDLILVDNSMESKQRCDTIRQVAKVAHRAIVVIHDYEHPPYQRAAKGFQHKYRFLAFNPNTGLVWNNNDYEANEFRRIDLAIAKSNGAPNDINHWNALFDEIIPID